MLYIFMDPSVLFACEKHAKKLTFKLPQIACVSAELIVVFKTTMQFKKNVKRHDRSITTCPIFKCSKSNNDNKYMNA